MTYFVFWRMHTEVQRNVWLTITDYVFYSFWKPKFCALMALSTVVSYGAGLGFSGIGERKAPGCSENRGGHCHAAEMSASQLPIGANPQSANLGEQNTNNLAFVALKARFTRASSHHPLQFQLS